ncbi:MAG: hypothetical protein GY928_04170, partial [Colwellia sp.]|nr:hypothetical protein [Colwellia sp.]
MRSKQKEMANRNYNTNSNDSTLIQKAEELQNIKRIKQNRKNTLKFSNLGNSQQLKFFKNQYKKTSFTTDEPTLIYNNKPTKKSEALGSFFSNISGHITDPNTNPALNKINELNTNLNTSKTQKILTFTPHKPLPEEDEDQIVPIIKNNVEIDWENIEDYDPPNDDLKENNLFNAFVIDDESDNDDYDAKMEILPDINEIQNNQKHCIHCLNIRDNDITIIDITNNANTHTCYTCKNNCKNIICRNPNSENIQIYTHNNTF